MIRHHADVEDLLAARGVPSDLKAYVCLEVFNAERPVLLVSRPEGEWCFLCGGDHPDEAASYRVVGIGHPIASDPTLGDVLDLDADEEAERVAVGAAWVRSTL